MKSLLLRTLHEVFDECDRTRRAMSIEAIFDADCRFADPRGQHVGHQALERAIAALHAECPGYAFSAVGDADAVVDCGCLAWQFGPYSDQARITGMDVIIVKNGRISALYTFIDEEL